MIDFDIFMKILSSNRVTLTETQEKQIRGLKIHSDNSERYINIYVLCRVPILFT